MLFFLNPYGAGDQRYPPAHGAWSFAIMGTAFMPDLRMADAPMSEAITESIRVEVLSQHSPENSRPNQGEWVFQYTVRITNLGSETVQLISRHWIITDALEHTEEVRGPG